MLLILQIWLMQFFIFGISFFYSKQIVIVSIKKPGEGSALTKSYRPVGFLPVLSKLDKHILRSLLQKFYTDTPKQFSFKPKHSKVH